MRYFGIFFVDFFSADIPSMCMCIYFTKKEILYNINLQLT